MMVPAWPIWFVSFILLVWFNLMNKSGWQIFQHPAKEGDWPGEFRKLHGDRMHCRLAVLLDT
jgi:hypothetical protein